MARPFFIDYRLPAQGVAYALVDEALAEGFTEFVIVALRGNGQGENYELRVLSRPRPKMALQHILGVAQAYVQECLATPGSAQ